MKKVFYSLFLIFFLLLTNSKVLFSKIDNFTFVLKDESFANANIHFIENKGQIIDQFGNQRNDILFLLNQGNFKLQLRKSGFSYELSNYVKKISEINPFEKLLKLNEKIGINSKSNLLNFEKYDIKFHRVDIEFQNANCNTKIETDYKSTGFDNYYNIPNEPDGIQKVYNYQKITYKDIYPNIDLTFYIAHGNVKYDFIVNNNGDASQIRLAYSGADKLNLSEIGILEIETSLGTLKENIPSAYLISSERNYLPVKFVLDKNILSFQVNDYDKNKTLVIDPTIIWGTYYGGSGIDQGYGITRDQNNNIYFTGQTFSSSNIATSGSYQSTYGQTGDAFVVKFNSAGVRQWGTYFGSFLVDGGNAIAVDSSGNVFMTGYTTSVLGIASFGAHQTTLGGLSDAFLVKFNSSGSRQWATYYGGSNVELGFGVAADNSGNVYLTGETLSNNNIATTSGYQPNPGGYGDAFLVKFNSTGQRQWGTYYGASGVDLASGITCDNDGNVIIVGTTSSTDTIASSGSYQETNGGLSDAFIVKFDANCSRIWGTFFGGLLLDLGFGIAADNSNNLFITGQTESLLGISTLFSYQFLKSDSTDAYIAKFNSDGQRDWGTYYGGNGIDVGNSIASDNSGNIVLAGRTGSTNNMSSLDGYQPVYGGGSSDAFFAKFNTTGQRNWGSYYGGDSIDIGTSTVFDIQGNILITGYTLSSSGISTNGSHQAVKSGATDAFIGKFEGANLQTITTTPFSGSYCAGDVIEVSYTVNVPFYSGNIFIAQISDGLGNFDNPVNIGTLNSISSGTITATIPDSTTLSVAYKIRVIGTVPVIIGTDNGSYLSIFVKPFAVISGPNQVLPGSNHNYTTSSNFLITRYWSVTGGIINGSNTGATVNITWGNPGIGLLTLIKTNTVTGCKDTANLEVTISAPYQTHSIGLLSGWNQISSYISPQNPNLDSVMFAIKNKITIMKDGTGGMYIPLLSINTIGNWNLINGYSLYMSSQATLEIYGTKAIPESTPINLNQGWNLVSYIRDSSMLIASALATIVNNIAIVKDGTGGMFIPSLGINTIGNMSPGHAYSIYLTFAAILIYPAN